VEDFLAWQRGESSNRRARPSWQILVGYAPSVVNTNGT
jgi:hypothetical protein